ncbi:hypothetical protein I5M27_02405 [Adhaeribacter sp. BT258]|uniref:Uncharacterized protein n=1 Tax=Adhaeribacter terrigena TaxID=2793070 RepID=A0ABS1BXF2_9BACT|nr:hypothetical protein [Adhaeribacter terrigena]MBK0401817.1 hypothetical protein [Adhaeribacter terrigena]
MNLKSNPNQFLFNSTKGSLPEESLIIDGKSYPAKYFFLYAELDQTDSFPAYHSKIFINLTNNKKVLFKEKYDYTKSECEQVIQLQLTDFHAKHIDMNDLQLKKAGYQIESEKYKTFKRKFLINQQLTIDFDANN